MPGKLLQKFSEQNSNLNPALPSETFNFGCLHSGGVYIFREEFREDECLKRCKFWNCLLGKSSKRNRKWKHGRVDQNRTAEYQAVISISRKALFFQNFFSDFFWKNLN